MSADRFFDTSIFIYHLGSSDVAKHRIAEELVRGALEARDACISYQVIQECLNVATRKARVTLSIEEARTYPDVVLMPLLRISASEALYHRALDVQARWRFSFYDSLIVAGALSAGCTTLFSEDLQDGQRIEGLTIRNPFR